MGVAGDHDVDRAVEFLHDVDDRAGDARAFIVVAGRQAAFVDQHHDGLDAARLQFGDQRIHRLGLVAEFEPGRADRRDDVRRALQRQADEGDRNAFELPDLVGGKHGLAGALLDRAGGEIVKFRARETDAAPGICRPGGSRHSASAAIRPCPRRIRDCRRRRAPAPSSTALRWWARHGTSPTETGWRRSDRRPRRRSCCLCPSRSCLTSVAMCSAPPAGDDDLFGLVVGIGDPDAARRRAQVAVEIVDRENAQLDRRGGLGVRCAASAVMIASARIRRKAGLMASTW